MAAGENKPKTINIDIKYVKAKRYPNSKTLAARFELSRKTIGKKYRILPDRRDYLFEDY